MFRRTNEQNVRDLPFVDIGALQATGTVSAAATWDGLINGKQRTGLTELTITVTGKAVEVGETLVIAGTTDYNGLHPIIKVIDATHVIIDVAFVSSQSGTWTMLGAKGHFIGMEPLTADLTGANITSMTFFDESAIKGDPTLNDYLEGNLYTLPGILTEIVLAAGNVRLYRYPNNNPQQ